jgi:hypothetical protein
MVNKIAQPEDILMTAQKLYPGNFRDISESGFMDNLYLKAPRMPGVKEAIEKGNGQANVAEFASGTGRAGNAIRKVTGTEFNYYCIDIDRRQFGKEDWKSRITGRVENVPLADKTQDVVFMLNVPIPISEVKSRLLKEGSLDYTKKRMLEMLENVIDAQYKLNLLEGVRVLKDDGVMVIGGKYVLQTEDKMQKNIEDLPLKITKLEIVDVDENVIPLWRKYGIDIENPSFMLVSMKKTKGDIREAVDSYEQLLYSSLEQVMRIQGKEEGKSRIEEVFEEMKNESKLKPGNLQKREK